MIKKNKTAILIAVLLSVLLFQVTVFAQSFKERVGKVKVADVNTAAPIQIPVITWGGDMVTFYANGGLKTTKDSIFDKLGLNIELVVRDDLYQQAREYMEGKSPFLRGTFRMMAQASELIASDPKTKGVMVMQLTWSAGDHCVVRKGIKTINDLKGKKIVLQSGGPHVGMLDDILRTAKLTWDDIEVVWARDLSASSNSPAEIFRINNDVAAAFVITPDMIGLSGGLENTGTGAEGTVAGARVLVSTANMSYSIADVYVARSDFYYQNKAWVEKFVAGYLKAAEEVIELRKQYESKGSSKFMKLLQMTQDIYGKEVIPTLEEDAYGLLADAVLAGHPGNVAFFSAADNKHGFDVFMDRSLELVKKLGIVENKVPISKHDLDYNSAVFLNYLTKTDLAKGQRFKAEAVQQEIEELTQRGGLDEKTIASFTIKFDANQIDFSPDEYAPDFDEVLKGMEQFGAAVLAVRGHADPTLALKTLIEAGINKGILQKSGKKGAWEYFFNGKPLGLKNTAEIVSLIESGVFEHAQYNARAVAQQALNLSRKRAEAIRKSFIAYAKGKKINIDESQIQAFGVGIREPLVPKPANQWEAKMNMRGEFSIIRTSAETMNPQDFDF
ncbi:MAG: ABC transporter substrate-binding protein [Candidatus Omnitrophica bacterium]|nr:ABC transporter substrate-binding protein [Candidatus Omnitrophota bacterium]